MATVSPCAAVRTTSCPPSGIACLALMIRFKQRLPKRLAVEHHARQIRIEIAHDLDASLLRLGREEIEHVVDLVIQIGRLQVQPPHFGEVEKIVEQRLQPLTLAAHDFHAL